MKQILKNLDYIIIICMFALTLIGIVGIYSAGYSTSISNDEYIKQIVFFGIGIIFIVTLLVIPNYIHDFIGYALYVINLILLIAVLFTSKLMGASSWFNLGGILYQPSELMKIGYIIVFAKLLSTYQKSIKKSSKIKLMILMMFSFLIPVILILLQPDFGTAIVFLVITFFMLFKSGLKYRYIIGAIVLILILIPLVYNFLLNDTQKARIDVYLDPTLDPLGTGYNAIQSQIAVGSGMLFGTGILQGVQTQLGYIPIKTSDFIYSVISEEMGFLMSALIIILFIILILRLILNSKNAYDEYSSLVIIGICGMIFFHFIQNIGMTIGILPITGVPLPFVSYGGSNMITNCIAIGMILKIVSKKTKNLVF